MQKVLLEGRLGRDAEIKEASNGNKYLKFTMAVNWYKVNKKTEKTTWYDVYSFNSNHFGKLAESLTSGVAVFVTGDLEPEINEGKDGKTYLNMSVKADSINFLRTNKKNDEQVNSVSKQPNKTAEYIPDDDISCIPQTVEVKTTPTETKPTDDADDLPF